MSIIDTLITDRTKADVERVKTLASKWVDSEWTGTTAELSEWMNRLKGAYNATDLNRVTGAMEYILNRLSEYGYMVPYTKITHERTDVPAGYTQLQYIELTGTQYIDTGKKPDYYTTIYGKFQTNQTSSGGIAAVDTAWQSNGFGVWVNAVEFGDEATLDITMYGDTPIEFLFSNNGLDVSVGGGPYEAIWAPTNPSETFAVDQTLPVGALRRNGAISEYLTGKLYYFQYQHKNDVELVLLPCKTPDGEVGMYDVINRQFYGNAGTGTFVAGPEETPSISDTWEIYDIPTSGQMAQYLENLSNLRAAISVKTTTPPVPSTMENLTHEEANDIEKILTDLDELLTNMAAAWFYSGDLYSGEV